MSVTLAESIAIHLAGDEFDALLVEIGLLLNARELSYNTILASLISAMSIVLSNLEEDNCEIITDDDLDSIGDVIKRHVKGLRKMRAN